jgi:hypothetical protein
MRELRRLFPALALAAAVAAAACSDSNGPEDVDPEAMDARLDAVVSTFENNIAFQSMTSLAWVFPSFGATSALRAALPAAPRPDGWTATTAGRLAQLRLLAGLRAPTGELALFPVDVLGKTFVWDVNADAYVVGQDAGAPPSGIRIILYAVNPVSGMPVEPLQPLGALDLTDESVAAADKLGVELRLGPTVIADYYIQLTVGTTTAAVDAVGFLRSPDGASQLNFDLGVSVNAQTQQVSLLFDVTGSEGTSVHLALVAGDDGGALTFRVSGGGNTIELTLDANVGGASGTIKFNGVVVATITEGNDGTQITGANGRQLTAEEVNALLAIFERVGDFLENFVGGILGPGDIVFGSAY